MFNEYSSGEREITEEGVGRFFSDLGVDPMDPVTLVISYHMGAKNMGEYTETEFINGFKALGCNSIRDMKNILDTLRKQLHDKTEFVNIYKYVFNFLKGEDARNVVVDHAIAMWDLLLTERYGKQIQSFLDKWKEFLEKQKTEHGLNGIKKDEWNSLLELFAAKGTKVEDMKGNEEECWPILFDSFFEHVNSS